MYQQLVGRVSCLGVLEQALCQEHLELVGPVVRVVKAGGVGGGDVVQGTHGVHLYQGRLALGCRGGVWKGVYSCGSSFLDS